MSTATTRLNQCSVWIRRFSKLLPLAFFLLMLLKPDLSFQGAKAGLLLWFDILLPTLLPFLILSGLLMRLRVHNRINQILYPVLKHIFPISKEGCYPIMLGFLSGLPVGAKTVGELTTQGSLGRDEGNYLLTLCNNASPAFLLSYVAATKLQKPEFGIRILLAVYLGAALSAIIGYKITLLRRRRGYHNQIFNEASFPLSQKLNLSVKQPFLTQLEESILKSFETMVKIGGFLMLFSILAAYLPFLLPGLTHVNLITCTLEMTAGIHFISLAMLPQNLKIVLTIATVSFAGISGLAQTQSVIKGSGLSLRYYFFVKLLGTAISCLLAMLL